MSDAKVSEVKHTPGPWEADGNDVAAINSPEDGGDIICSAPEGFEESMRRWEANARLIAEAPMNPHNCGDKTCSGYKAWLEWQSLRDINKDLLEALQSIVNTWGNSHGGRDGLKYAQFSAAEAAIRKAKAEGR